LVLIDKDFKVVGLREMVRPFRITRPIFRAESVLELPVHAIFKSRTEVGDQLVIERYEAKKFDSADPAEAAQVVLQGSEMNSARSDIADIFGSVTHRVH